MTVFEPDKAQWKSADGMLVDADVSKVTIHLGWSMGSRPAHRLGDLTMNAEQAEQAESMLMNARLWLVKASKQRADLEAAAQLADDGPVSAADGDSNVFCNDCKHLAESHCQSVKGDDTCASGGGCHATGCRCTRSIWQVLRGRRWAADRLRGTVRYYPIPTETTEGTNR
ncbi:MAG: hypothetical protein IPJ61_20605 [Tessaracoccus sp.]|uniref:hypothetical protein n=1 Tax=Tessaracoccus sp. TaxID=1971211 RepID=UPI001EC14CEC|nr:hypothetical protein [Tessaracoccus sp.]MBK7823390.1 hypothetical protein [Tessaracoccus sp.]